MQLVFVCSGNTCRSPLALCAWRLAVQEISARGGGGRGSTFPLGQIEASSAGLCATPGASAALHAQTIARSWGQDLSGHQAALFRPQHAQADLVVTMTGDQSAVLRAHFSVVRGQVRQLGEYAPRGVQVAQTALWAPLWEDSVLLRDGEEQDADILDPLGGSLEAYEACATRIRRCVFELAALCRSPNNLC